MLTLLGNCTLIYRYPATVVRQPQGPPEGISLYCSRSERQPVLKAATWPITMRTYSCSYAALSNSEPSVGRYKLLRLRKRPSLRPSTIQSQAPGIITERFLSGTRRRFQFGVIGSRWKTGVTSPIGNQPLFGVSVGKNGPR